MYIYIYICLRICIYIYICMAVSMILVPFFVGVLLSRAFLFGVCIRTPECWKLPHICMHIDIQPKIYVCIYIYVNLSLCED